jgi:hypothetical protein
MSQAATFWQKYGTLAQMAQASVALLGFVAHHLPFLCEKNAVEPAYFATYATNTQQWIKASLQRSGIIPPECKLRKT